MKKNSTYNGTSNESTWQVLKWLTIDEASHSRWSAAAQEARKTTSTPAAANLKLSARMQQEARQDIGQAQGVNWSEVNWNEVAADLLRDWTPLRKAAETKLTTQDRRQLVQWVVDGFRTPLPDHLHQIPAVALAEVVTKSPDSWWGLRG